MAYSVVRRIVIMYRYERVCVSFSIYKLVAAYCRDPVNRSTRVSEKWSVPLIWVQRATNTF